MAVVIRTNQNFAARQAQRLVQGLALAPLDRTHVSQPYILGQ